LIKFSQPTTHAPRQLSAKRAAVDIFQQPRLSAWLTSSPAERMDCSPETARAKNEQSRNFNVEETLSQPS